MTRRPIASLRIALPLALTLTALTPPRPARAQAAQSDDPDAPISIVRRDIDDVLAILRDPSLRGPAARERRMARIRDVADRAFDWTEVARRSLGAHWLDATEPQRARFIAVFKDLLADKYRSDMDRFQGDEQVQVTGSEPAGDLTIVHSTLVTHSRDRVPIDYWLARRDGAWRIVDFAVEGVSLVNHFRGTFSRYLVNHDFDTLLSTLERKHDERALTDPSRPRSQ